MTSGTLIPSYPNQLGTGALLHQFNEVGTYQFKRYVLNHFKKLRTSYRYRIVFQLFALEKIKNIP